MKFTIEVDEVVAGPFVNLAGQLKVTAEALMAEAVEQVSEVLRLIAPDAEDENQIESRKPKGLRLLPQCVNTLRFMEETEKWNKESRKSGRIIGNDRDAETVH